ncbi:hypothetical protein RR46_14051 [Papilio xuthus]|uniref:MADF domain-containing protein n=1 Tax=Papilio xuthus TaxID=66420 RepID=A0A194PNX7_PAPXU|nr:hypothetical protein RR46_14051 [Papilio xuthus]
MSTKWRNDISEERKFLSEFIDVYKSLPALWDSKKKIYYDRHKKNAAYEILIKKYREMYPKATREDVRKKINVFRSNYRNGLRKYYEALKSAKDKDLVPKPSLWYFKKFSFLKLSFGNLDINTDTSIFNSAQNNSEGFNVNTEPTVSILTSTGISIKMERKNYNENDDSDDVENCNEIVESNTQFVSNQGDEYYYWAMALAADIRKMDTTQQIYAKKAIAEVIMEGQLGLLHRNSIKINEDPL